jgi:hypothetical protein
MSNLLTPIPVTIDRVRWPLPVKSEDQPIDVTGQVRGAIKASTFVTTIVLRVLNIVGGLFLALVNSQGEGTFLGLLPPTTPGRLGFDIAKVLIYWLCGWLIYRGFKPATKPGQGSLAP